MSRVADLLPRAVRALTPGSLGYRVLDRAERLLLARRVPVATYRAAGARLVRLGGELTVSTPVTDPQVDEAQTANLDLVLEVCDEVGAERFVVTTTRRRHTTTGAAASHRAGVLGRLAERGGREPLYVTVVPAAGEPRRGLGVELTPADAEEAVSVYVWRSRHDPVTGRNHGRAQACRLDFWEELPDGRLSAPAPNLRAAQVTAEERHAPAQTEVAGRAYGTLEPFAARDAFDVDFEVDLVYLWVDDRDPAWRRRRDERLAALGRPPSAGAADDSRFREQDELRYSLRSVERYAPWVRHIHLVTDDQRPAWLVDDHPRLTVVDHRDILPAEALPTYNSHAISARAHHIEGLSEHFLLMNDDVLLGRPVGPEDFFHASGITRFFLSRSPIPSGPIAADDPPHMAARKRVRDLITETYGFRPHRTFKHTPVAFQRSWFEHLEERFADVYERTVHNPFRSSEDIVPSWLYHYSAYSAGRAVPGNIVYDYFNLSSRQAFERLVSLLNRRSVDCLCLNDDDAGDLPLERRTVLMAAFLELLLPRPSSFERAPGPPGDPRELMRLMTPGALRE